MEIFNIGINTCYSLIKELERRPNSFVTVTVGDKEYAIKCTKLVKTHGNIDDTCVHTTLVCDELSGNIVR